MSQRSLNSQTSYRPPVSAFRRPSGGHLSAQAAAILDEEERSNPSTTTADYTNKSTEHSESTALKRRLSEANSDPSTDPSSGFVTNPSSYFYISDRNIMPNRALREDGGEGKSEVNFTSTSSQAKGAAPLYLPPMPTSLRSNNKKRVSFQGLYPPPPPPQPQPAPQAYNVQAYHGKHAPFSSSSHDAKKVLSEQALRKVAIVCLIVLVCTAFFVGSTVDIGGSTLFTSPSNKEEEKEGKEVAGVYKSPRSFGDAVDILPKLPMPIYSSDLEDPKAATSDIEVMKTSPPTTSPASSQSQQQPQTQIPNVLSQNLVNMNVKQNVEYEIPLYWYLPQSGHGAIEGIFGSCLKLVLASGLGSKIAGYEENRLNTIDFYGSTFVDVDLTTPEGIERASRLNLVNSDLAHVFLTPLLHPTTSLFTPPKTITTTIKQGRFFAIFRDPIERAISTFLHLSSQDHSESRLVGRQSSSSLPQTMKEYASSSHVENNPLTRAILNKPLGVLTAQDALNAQETLRQKCLVGLYEKMEESIERFERYFGWYHEQSATFESDGTICRSTVIASTKSREDVPWVLDVESDVYKLLASHNLVDMLLYKYVKALYRFQGEMFFGAI